MRLQATTCPMCGKVFQVEPYRVVGGATPCCSRACLGALQHEQAASRLWHVTCGRCGKSAMVTSAIHRAGRAWYCCKECSFPRHGVLVTCPMCGTEHYARQSKMARGHAKYCSVACKRLAMRVPVDAALRPRICYYARMWRAAVLERDGGRCVRCGSGAPPLHAHHRIPWYRRPELRFDVTNGETLCVTCHRAVHSRNGEEPNPHRHGYVKPG